MKINKTTEGFEFVPQTSDEAAHLQRLVFEFASVKEARPEPEKKAFSSDCPRCGTPMKHVPVRGYCCPGCNYGW